LWPQIYNQSVLDLTNAKQEKTSTSNAVSVGVVDQKVEQEWETPSPEEIISLTRALWVMAGMHHLLVRTTGRRTGDEHKVALPVWFDPEGHRIVVASFAGAKKDPAWYLNLAAATDEVSCKSQSGEYFSRVEILDGQEYERIWNLLVEDRSWYTDYQAQAERRLPLVRLPETRIP
jgi:deazaflavin-dependent oxidoreductase (nitroreductase family)